MRKFRVSVDGNSYEVEVDEIRDGAEPAPRSIPPVAAPVARPAQKRAAVPAAKPGRTATGTVKAPMPGTILSISVEAGDAVAGGQVLCMLEAMKMENEVRAVADGVIESVEITTGDQISAGQIMFVLA